MRRLSVLILLCASVISGSAQVSFYFDSIIGQAAFKSDAIYYYSSLTIAKGDYEGNIFWVKHIPPGSKLTIGEDAVFGYKGFIVFKLDTAGNTQWVRNFSVPVNPASVDSNRIGDLVYDGSKVYISMMQGQWPDLYPSILTLDTGGNILNVSANVIHPGGGFSLQPCCKILQGGAWIGYNYQPGFTNSSYLIKVDTTGNYDLSALSTSYFFSTVTSLRSITPLEDSSYLVLTYSENWNQAIPQAFFTCSKITASGNPRWQNHYYNASFACGLHVTDAWSVGSDTLGYIYVIGTSSEQPCVGIPTGGIFYMKLDSMGNIIYVKSFGAALNAVSVSGQMKFKNGKLFCNATYKGHSAILIVDTLFSNPCFVTDTSIFLTKVVESLYASPIMSTPPVIAYAPLNDTINVMSLNIDQPLDLCIDVYNPEINKLKDEFILFPNPATGKFNIRNSKFKIESFCIYNLFGEKIIADSPLNFAEKPGGDAGNIDISSQPAGVYFILIKSEDKFFSYKLIKE